MNDKEEIYLTEIETDLMGVFVKYGVLSDEKCATILVRLAEKLNV